MLFSNFLEQISKPKNAKNQLQYPLAIPDCSLFPDTNHTFASPFLCSSAPSGLNNLNVNRPTSEFLFIPQGQTPKPLSL